MNRTYRWALVAVAALLLPAAGASALLSGLGDPLGASTSHQVSTPAGTVGASANGGTVCADADLNPSALTGTATGAAAPALGVLGGVTGAASGALAVAPVVGSLPSAATGLTQQATSVGVSSHTCLDADVPLPAVPELPTVQGSSDGGRGPVSSAIHDGTDAVGSAVKAVWDRVASLF